MTFRLMLIMTAVFLALSSCSTLTSEPAGPINGGPTAQDINRRRPSQGGAFSATYSGEWNTHRGQCGTTFCTTWKFHGSGTATALGSSRERGVVQGGFGSGDAVLMETGSRGNFFRVHLSGGFCSPHLSYTVSGGKGVFKSASGSGTIHFACTGTKRGSYKDNWSGTLY